METSPRAGSIPLATRRARVFLSYSSKDKPTALAVKDVLENAGLDVWIDKEDMRGSPDFRASILAAIAEAHAVVVLWSENSVKSAYVPDEAERGRAKLVAARIDDVALPVGFGSVHTYDLRDWDHESGDHEEFSRMLEAIELVARRTVQRPGGRWPLVRTSVAVAGAASVLLWIGIRLSWVATAVLLGLAVLFAATMLLLGRMPVLRSLARRACSRWGAAACAVVGIACWLFVPVRLEGGPPELDGAVAVAHTDEGATAAAAELQKGSAKLWTFTVLPRTLRVRVPGYVERPVEVHPLSPATYRLGEDVRADPTVVVRIGLENLFLVNGATVHVVEGEWSREKVLAEAVLTEKNGSIVVGPAADLAPRLDEWRKEIDRSDEMARVSESGRNAFVELWANPVSLPWSRGPSSSYANVRVRLTTRAGARLRSRPFQLGGVITDVQVHLEESPR